MRGRTGRVNLSSALVRDQISARPPSTRKPRLHTSLRACVGSFVYGHGAAGLETATLSFSVRHHPPRHPSSSLPLFNQTKPPQFPVVLGFMYYFDNFTQPALMYLMLHSVYCWCWLTKVS